MPDENLCKQAFLIAACVLAGARFLRILCVCACACVRPLILQTLSEDEVQEFVRLSEREIALERELAAARVTIVMRQNERGRPRVMGFMIGGGVGFGVGAAVSLVLGTAVGVVAGLATALAVVVLVPMTFKLGDQDATAPLE